MLTIRQISKIMRRANRYSDSQRCDRLADRAKLAAHIAACTEGGLVAVIQAGMDCDCSKYRYVDHIPAPTVTAFELSQDRYYDSLDGPGSMGIGKPSEYPTGSESRDLAAEAFENGHPYAIHA